MKFPCVREVFIFCVLEQLAFWERNGKLCLQLENISNGNKQMLLYEGQTWQC